jgi:transposase-like protein
MHKLVSAYHNSGQSQKTFAQAHGLTEGKLHYWIKKLSKESIPSLETSSFIPLEMPHTESSSSKVIIIRTSDGLEIQIPM